MSWNLIIFWNLQLHPVCSLAWVSNGNVIAFVPWGVCNMLATLTDIMPGKRKFHRRAEHLPLPVFVKYVTYDRYFPSGIELYTTTKNLQRNIRWNIYTWYDPTQSENAVNSTRMWDGFCEIFAKDSWNCSRLLTTFKNFRPLPLSASSLIIYAIN